MLKTVQLVAAAPLKMCPILEARSHHRKGGSKPQLCVGTACQMWTVVKTTKGVDTIYGDCGLKQKP